MMGQGELETRRASPGGFAITVFVGSAIYLVLFSHGWQTLLTFKAVIFLVLGVFFSVLVVGVPFHLLGVWIERRFFSSVEVPVAHTRVWYLKTLTTALMVLQVVVTFYATKLAYYWYFS
jgi:hypothetical protein